MAAWPRPPRPSHDAEALERPGPQTSGGCGLQADAPGGPSRASQGPSAAHLPSSEACPLPAAGPARGSQDGTLAEDQGCARALSQGLLPVTTWVWGGAHRGHPWGGGAGG